MDSPISSEINLLTGGGLVCGVMKGLPRFVLKSGPKPSPGGGGERWKKLLCRASTCCDSEFLMIAALR